jgi:hypothetical protein
MRRPIAERAQQVVRRGRREKVPSTAISSDYQRFPAEIGMPNSSHGTAVAGSDVRAEKW